MIAIYIVLLFGGNCLIQFIATQPKVHYQLTIEYSQQKLGATLIRIASKQIKRLTRDKDIV